MKRLSIYLSAASLEHVSSPPAEQNTTKKCDKWTQQGYGQIQKKLFDSFMALLLLSYSGLYEGIAGKI
jgi:hypothetical protein